MSEFTRDFNPDLPQVTEQVPMQPFDVYPAQVIPEMVPHQRDSVVPALRHPHQEVITVPSDAIETRQLERPAIDTVLVEKVLGHQFSFNPDPAVYDERRQIALEIEQKATDQRTRAITVAEAMGIAVTPEEVAAWRPEQPEIAQIRAELRGRLQQARMMHGMSTYREAQDKLTASIDRRTLRVYQAEAVDSINRYWVEGEPLTAQGSKSCLVNAPTGVGKTDIAGHTIAGAKFAELPEEPIRALVLTPTVNNRNQTARSISRVAPDMDVGVYGAREKNLESDVLVMCTASFLELYKQGALPEDINLIIADEAHTVVGDATGAALRDYCADKLAIGFTATPDYDEARTARQLFPETVYEMQLREAVLNGILAPVRAYALQPTVEIDSRTLPDDPSERRAAIRAAHLEAFDNEAMEIVYKELKKRPAVGAIVRCRPGNNIQHAEDMAERIRGVYTVKDSIVRNIRAAAVGGSGRLTEDESNTLLDMFDKGTVDVLTHVKALGMGYDCPRAKLLVNTNSSASRVEIVQNLGRILRSFNGEEARAYDVIDPFMPNQFTILDALGTKDGELLKAERTVDMPVPKPRPHRDATPRERAAAAEVTNYDIKVVGEVALGPERTVKAEFPRVDHLAPDTTLNRNEACRFLGISPRYYDRLMRGVGSDATQPISPSELRTFLELHPQLYAPTLPAEGYLAMQEVVRLVDEETKRPGMVNEISLKRYALSQQKPPVRFATTDADGQEIVGDYFTTADADDLIRSGIFTGFMLDFKP